jgi:hypothetical protein
MVRMFLTNSEFLIRAFHSLSSCTQLNWDALIGMLAFISVNVCAPMMSFAAVRMKPAELAFRYLWTTHGLKAPGSMLML